MLLSPTGRRKNGAAGCRSVLAAVLWPIVAPEARVARIAPFLTYLLPRDLVTRRQNPSNEPTCLWAPQLGPARREVDGMTSRQAQPLHYHHRSPQAKAKAKEEATAAKAAAAEEKAAAKRVWRRAGGGARARARQSSTHFGTREQMLPAPNRSCYRPPSVAGRWRSPAPPRLTYLTPD